MEDNNTLKVLIAEDEAAVRRSLCQKINWEELNLKVVAEAQNAEEAYEVVKTNPPEIILLDMRMPGMGGMKLLEILKEQFPEIKVIILSGHSDFEYMRQALKCGAIDYLLKPIVKEDLKAALLKVIANINEERKTERETSYRNALLNESVPLLKANLLNKLLIGIHLNAAEILKKFTFLNINLDYQYYILAVIKITNYEEVKSVYMNDMSLIFFALDNLIMESIGAEKNAVGFKNSQSENEYIYIFGVADREGIKERLGKLFKENIVNIEKSNNLKIDVSISDICESLLDLPKIYKITSHIWGKKKTVGSSRVLFPENFYKESQLQDLIPLNDVMQITECIEENDKQSLMSIINGLFEQLEIKELKNMEHSQEVAAKVYFCIETILERLAFNVGSVFNTKILAYNDLITKCQNPDDIKYGLLKVVTEVADWISRKQRIESNKIIAKAKEYIDKYYFEDISLEYMAKKSFLNTSYFCEIFKKEVGNGFNKYLNMIRIEKAKELLRDQDMKPTDVAELVGFKELGYFCIVFKKYTGLTPTEFKKNIG